MIVRYLLITSLFSLVTLACLTRQELPPPPATVAVVNGKTILEDTLKFRLNLEKAKYDDKTYKSPTRFLAIKREVLQRMIQNQAVIDWGKKQGIEITVEERAQGLTRLKQGYTDKEFELMLQEKNISFVQWSELSEENLAAQKVMQETLYKKIKVSSHEILSHYKNNQKDFEVDERVRVRQIVTDSPEKANHLHERVMRGENFAEVAIMHSLAPDRNLGGDLGYFSRGTYPQEFDDACFKLKIGEISPVIQSPYGFHIFKLIDKKPKGTLSLEEALPRIESELLQKKMAQQYDSWLNRVLSESEITMSEPVLENLEL